MSFKVTKLAQGMVSPAQPTPYGNLELSAIDRLPGLQVKARTFHVFEHGLEPGKVIRKALGMALVHYYPFAGRLARPDGNGELHVACTGEGVWFIEASANCNLEEINSPEVPLHSDLLPDPPPGEDPANVIMFMQVTQFNCGGFVIGLENSHCISDGLGTAQFLNALAELARGLSSPSVLPIWRPAAIPSPPNRAPFLPPASPTPPTFNLRRATIDLPLECINAFKSRFLSAAARPCSAFEALAATLWQSRTRAILKNADFTQARVVFMANARSLIRPPLPQGFCSNCFFPVRVSASADWLASATAVEVVQLIRQAKEGMPDEFRRWEAGEGEDPYLPEMGYGTLFLSEWSRLGFEKVDFGWGMPREVVPLTYTDLIPVIIVGSLPAPAKGVRLSTQCVVEDHVSDFQECMRRAWDSSGEWQGQQKLHL